MNQWSASLICADLLSLGETLQELDELGVSYLHVDVMDGSFVPRLGMYPEMVKAIKNVTAIPVEVHLMIENPETYIPLFKEVGADIATVHLEACRGNITRTLELIKREGMRPGLALNPGSECPELAYFSETVDYLLIMGINPGVLGQKIKPFILEKIQRYRTIFSGPIIIDGGVNFHNYEELYAAGATILVGGSQTLFHPASSLADNFRKLHHDSKIQSHHHC